MWQLIETWDVDKDEQILGGFTHSSDLVILRWFKYDGLLAWRDWDNDVRFPSHWMSLPKPPS